MRAKNETARGQTRRTPFSCSFARSAPVVGLGVGRVANARVASKTAAT
jgi:hypothetical protein